MRVKFFYLLFIVMSSIGLLISFSFNNELTSERRQAISKVIDKYGFPKISPPKSFREEIELIKTVQSMVFDLAPVNDGIPHGEDRGPEALFSRGKGLCYDRSYVIEQILKLYNMSTRHVSIYEVKSGFIHDLLTPGISSHALTEVLTSKGWVAVDSNSKTMFLENDNPIDLSTLRKLKFEEKVEKWGGASPLLFENFHIIYGLYSRHGMFYPPFNSIPDYNIKELRYNL